MAVTLFLRFNPGSNNTLPVEIAALIASGSTPTLFAIGTVTAAVSFLLIGVT